MCPRCIWFSRSDVACTTMLLVTQRSAPRRTPPVSAPVVNASTEPASAPDPVRAEPPAEPQSDPERILASLERNQWNRRKTASELGMSYQTLRRRIEKYGLDQRM